MTPAFATNHYDVRLRGEFQKIEAGVLPNLDIRAAQDFHRTGNIQEQYPRRQDDPDRAAYGVVARPRYQSKYYARAGRHAIG